MSISNISGNAGTKQTMNRNYVYSQRNYVDVLKTHIINSILNIWSSLHIYHCTDETFSRPL